MKRNFLNIKFKKSLKYLVFLGNATDHFLSVPNCWNSLFSRPSIIPVQILADQRTSVITDNNAIGILQTPKLTQHYKTETRTASIRRNGS